MKPIFEILPDVELSDPAMEARQAGIALDLPDDDDLIRPAAEEELFRVGLHGSLAGRGNAPLAKHLVWTFGPYHRALPFPLQLRVELDGDRLVTVEAEIGWLHQGLEKAAELTPWRDGFRVVEQLHPRCSIAAELAWALALERLLGVADEVPTRAQRWRVIALELHRISEHTRVLTRLVSAHLPRAARLGVERCARDVEALLRRLVDDDGAPFRCVGGLSRAVPDALAAALERLPVIVQPMREVAGLLGEEHERASLLRGLGAVSRRRALELGLTGPALRATGLADDVRAADAVFAYGVLPPRVHTASDGDARGRALVRAREIEASAAVVGAALIGLPETPETLRIDDVARLERDPPAGTATGALETPAGELSIFVVSDGGPTPRRVRLKTPSFSLCGALPALLLGGRLDDVVTVLESLGLCGAEIDR